MVWNVSQAASQLLNPNKYEILACPNAILVKEDENPAVFFITMRKRGITEALLELLK
jgi:hypothetical protein